MFENEREQQQQLKGRLVGNMLYAFSAQMISLLVSLLLSLVVPKILGVSEFAYWQLFVFYSNYVNVSQLGVVDGIYLRIGGKNYDDLNFGMLKSEYIVFGFFQIIVGLIIAIAGFSFTEDSKKSIVFLGVAIYLIIYNLSRYLGFIFQAVNNTKWFSVASMVDRITILLLGTLAIIAKKVCWQLFICIYVTGIAVSLLYSWSRGKSVLASKDEYPLFQVIGELKENAFVGINLMISNLASTLILGVGRQAIEIRWGLETFGRVSYALSMTNFFLLFINQVSLVMFPALRKIGKDQSKSVYKKLDFGFSLISPIVYIVYIPAAFLLKKWLPQYESNLTYLMLFMPVCVFDGKMQMIYNTYLKAFRRERGLLRINLFSLALSILNAVVSICIFDSLRMLLIGLVMVIMIRSLISSYYLTKVLKCELTANFVYDLFFAILFILLCTTQNNLVAEMILIMVGGLFFIFNVIGKQRGV